MQMAPGLDFLQTQFLFILQNLEIRSSALDPAKQEALFNDTIAMQNYNAHFSLF
jgi:hypothetical protein